MLTARRVLTSCLLLTLLAASPAWSGVTFEMREVGGDVVLSGSGKPNPTPGALTPFMSGVSLGGQVDPAAFFLSGAPGGLTDVYDAANFSGPTAIGPGTSAILADSGSGVPFGVNFLAQRVGLGSSLPSGSSTWNGETLASLGVAPGSYIWTWGSGATADSITLLAIGGNCSDADGDGYGSVGDPDCPGGLAADCNDGDPLIHPGAADVCDGVDNNCQDGADEGSVCGSSLVDGTEVVLKLEFIQPAGDPPVQFHFPLVLGGPDHTEVVGPVTVDVDIENESVEVVVTNGTGGLGNVAVLTTLTGLEWTDATTRVIGASAVSDFDYVYASAPPPFPLPGVAAIVNGGRGIQVYTEEMLFQSHEVHTTTTSFAAGPVPYVPLLPAPAVALLVGAMGGVGVVFARRRASR